MPQDGDLALLKVRGLSKDFGGVKVLRNLSFEIRPGDFIVLRGANGSGKTTLLNILSGLLPPDTGEVSLHLDCEEAISYDFGRDRESTLAGQGFSLGSLARHGVMRSWQDVRLFSSLSLLDNLNVAARNQQGEQFTGSLFRRSKMWAEERAVAQNSVGILVSFGLTHLVRIKRPSRRVAERSAEGEGQRSAMGQAVSLGESKRVAIARACRGELRLLLLDEPLSGLDAPGINSVLRLLAQLQREREIAMLIVEHESTIHHLAGMAASIWTLDRGTLVTDKPQSLSSIPRSRFLRHWVKSVLRDGDAIRNRDLPQNARLTVVASTSSQSDGLVVKSLSVARGGRPVLPPLSFEIPRGGLGILQAPNGWGKTSLAEAIAGLLPIAGGQVIVAGSSLNAQSAWQRRANGGVSFLQSKSNSFPKLKVSEALGVCGAKEVPSYLRHLEDRTIASLSGGERQRLLFACSLVGDPIRLALWDEPFHSLDESGIKLLSRRVRSREPHETVLMLIPAIIGNAANRATTK